MIVMIIIMAGAVKSLLKMKVVHPQWIVITVVCSVEIMILWWCYRKEHIQKTVVVSKTSGICIQQQLKYSMSWTQASHSCYRVLSQLHIHDAKSPVPSHLKVVLLDWNLVTVVAIELMIMIRKAGLRLFDADVAFIRWVGYTVVIERWESMAYSR